jgi:hypothetical protein
MSMEAWEDPPPDPPVPTPEEPPIMPFILDWMSILKTCKCGSRKQNEDGKEKKRARKEGSALRTCPAGQEICMVG